REPQAPQAEASGQEGDPRVLGDAQGRAHVHGAAVRASVTWAARLGVCAALLSACAPRVGEPAMGEAAATVIYEPRLVRTMDPARPMAEAVALRGAKVAGVGSRAQLEQEFAGAKVVPMPGAVIVPGLADAHVHLSGLGNHLAVVNFSAATSEADAIE